MEMNEEQEIEFREISYLVIKYINNNSKIFDPHTQLVFDSVSATIFNPDKRLMTHEFLHD